MLFGHPIDGYDQNALQIDTKGTLVALMVRAFGLSI
jgi:hypothetical protein